MDWQLVIVAMFVAAALGVVVQRCVRWLQPSSRGGSACGTGGCSGCASSGTSPPVVELKLVKLTDIQTERR